MHYWRWHRHGDVQADVAKKVSLSPSGRCTWTTDCAKPVVARDLCRGHYSAYRMNDPQFRAEAKAYTRQWKADEYRRDPVRVRARHNAWMAANPERVKLAGVKKMRRRRAAPRVAFTVDQLDAKIRYWGGLCWICRDPWEAIDHVKPIGKRGWHALANLRPVCTPCNSRKRDKWPMPTSSQAAKAFLAT